MARADNFRTRQQQLYKNPFSNGVAYLAIICHIFSKLYIFRLSCHIFTMTKATGFKFGTVIDQISTNQKNVIYPQCMFKTDKTRSQLSLLNGTESKQERTKTECDELVKSETVADWHYLVQLLASVQ